MELPEALRVVFDGGMVTRSDPRWDGSRLEMAPATAVMEAQLVISRDDSLSVPFPFAPRDVMADDWEEVPGD